MAERMTWDEIVNAYPKQFVYLTGLQRADENDPTTESAIVIHATDKNDEIEYIDRAVRGECVERYTDLAEMAPMGVLTL